MQNPAMDQPFLGTEAIASGKLTRHTLRRDFVALHRDVYIRKDVRITPAVRARAAWLRSRRRGILAGLSASSLHGARWIDPHLPAAIIDTNRRRTPGVIAWADSVEDDEVCVIGGMRVTTPARTALDLACRLPVDSAVAAIDALARATRLKMADVELLADRYRGRHGIRKARSVFDLVDPGAESPRETWLRLLLIRNGFPRPTTQIPVYDAYGALVAELDMGWEDIKVAAEYEGDHHRTDPDAFNKGIRRHDELTELGWIDVRVTKRDTEGAVIGRVVAAFARRRL
ncbi:hypothetical protein MMOR_02240 [Mycolicibacterium moriokaense]|uniref:Uncharacterized protein n=2 Tax=Mycolicibacterium moriokaense TaxID=39691 RepID=A0AAD1H8K8_9MYCO|nr:hypothetical protein MMOR_02240 [Mycolicibacterium moriokaense]